MRVHVPSRTLTSNVIGNEDFLALDDDKTDMSTGSTAPLWCGGTDFALETLLRPALTKSKRMAERSQEHPITTLQKDRSRLSQADSRAKAKSTVLPTPALSDVPLSSYATPPELNFIEL